MDADVVVLIRYDVRADVRYAKGIAFAGLCLLSATSLLLDCGADTSQKEVKERHTRTADGLLVLEILWVYIGNKKSSTR